MKRRICRLALLILAFASVAFTARAGWVQVGDTLAGAYAYGTHMAFGSNNEIYVAFQNGIDLIVRKYNGVTWQQIGDPGVSSGNDRFGFTVDRNGTPYIATDTMFRSGTNYEMRLIVRKYDGNSWVSVGDAGSFTRGTSSRSWGIWIAMDSTGMPCVAYSPTGVVRYNGATWDQISGAMVANLGLGEMASDPAGKLYMATYWNGPLIYKYLSDSTWIAEDITGLGDVSKDEELFAIGPSGTLYAQYFDLYGRDSTHVFQYAGNRWIQMGRTFPQGTILDLVFNASGAPYALNYIPQPTLIRYNGTDWLTVDTSATAVGIDGSNSPAVSDASGNIYTVVNLGTTGSRVMMYDTHQDALSVPAPLQAGEVSILPIPASQAVFIKNASTAISGLPATITDMHGRTVFEFVLAATQRVDISKWNTGVYFLHLPNGRVMKMLKD